MSLKVTTSQISFDVSNVKEKSSQWARPFRMRESSTDCLALVLYVLGILAAERLWLERPFGEVRFLSAGTWKRQP